MLPKVDSAEPNHAPQFALATGQSAVITPSKLVVLSLLSGLMLYLCYFPVAWGWFAWVALVPLMPLIYVETRGRTRYFLRLACGHGIFLAGDFMDVGGRH